MLGWNLGGSGRYGNHEAIDYAADTTRVLEWAPTGQLLYGRRDDAFALAQPSAWLMARAALSPR